MVGALRRMSPLSTPTLTTLVESRSSESVEAEAKTNATKTHSIHPLLHSRVWMCAPARDRRFAVVVAVLLFVFSNTQLAQSQDARPYAMMTLAMSAVLYFLFFVFYHTERASLSLLSMIRRDLPTGLQDIWRLTWASAPLLPWTTPAAVSPTNY